MAKLKATVSKRDRESIHLKIRKEDYEAFCSAAGLFRDSFLKTLRQSEKDLQHGRITRRRSLNEILSK